MQVGSYRLDGMQCADLTKCLPALRHAPLLRVDCLEVTDVTDVAQLMELVAELEHNMVKRGQGRQGQQHTGRRALWAGM